MTTTINKVSQIVSNKQAAQIDGVLVDLFTASAIMQVYNAINDTNKEKMAKASITKMAAVAMNIIGKKI